MAGPFFSLGKVILLGGLFLVALGILMMAAGKIFNLGRLPGDIFIQKDETNNARPGQKVVAEILKWPEKRRNAEGRIVQATNDRVNCVIFI
ncbi:MAG: DUF2905 family protein [Anoxybacillus ayderensis]|nr:DUF2905 family protein [Anoxybacillus ayderensis]